MSLQVTIEVDQQFEETVRKMIGISPRFTDALRESSMKAAFAIEAGAKPLTPVDTGTLRRSIAVSLGVANRGLTSIVQTNDPANEYAGIVHEGRGIGKNASPRPFMRQGVEAKEKVIQNIYKTNLEAVMRGIA